jgi:uncharacterized membrane protein YphA (DoxX/SURF4 family)
MAGLDKFTDLLVNWDKYLHPAIASMLSIAPHTFMIVVGIIEIIAGIIVLMRPQMGGLILSAWLVCIAINLVAMGTYFDIAVRDLVMAIGAFSLAQLSLLEQQRRIVNEKSGYDEIRQTNFATK